MCGIAGFCDFNRDLRKDKEKNREIAQEMGKTLVHRGPNDFGTYVGEHIAFAHTRLSVIDLAGGKQPMTKVRDGYEYTIIYNGELYNTKDIRVKLEQLGYEFFTTSDTEVLLTAYMEYGQEVVKYLNGIYSFVIWDSYEKCCFLCRDRIGVKPFFYSMLHGTLLFSSEIKGILAYPNMEAMVGEYGLCEIFGIGPARSPGCGVYENIHEIPPGYCGYLDYSGLKLYPYWKLEAKEHTDSYEDTVDHVRKLLFDSIERQLVSDVPICTLLSGGLDSSIISAVAARYLKKQGKQLSTYSFDYADNDKNFKASSFQPDQDRPFVDIMVKAIGSHHTYLECEYKELFYSLYEAVLAKDLPGMADVDSSMLYFARQIKKNHTVCLSGECADEIFGGYPWFRQEESYTIDAFPWSRDLDFRKAVLSESLLKRLPLEEYVRSQYRRTMNYVPQKLGESKTKRRQREISILNTSWFMNTLLDRKDRMTMASGLEVRVPYADHRIVEYLYNVPWEYKYPNQVVKGLLKDAVREVLPAEVIDRKKCPYPKTYDPMYERLLKEQLTEIIKNPNEPILELVNKNMIFELMAGKSDYGKPWFGQLMALPQMYAYLIEVNFWLTHYKIKLV